MLCGRSKCYFIISVFLWTTLGHYQCLFKTPSNKSARFTPQKSREKNQFVVDKCLMCACSSLSWWAHYECYLGRTHFVSSFHCPRTKHLESGTQPKCYRLIWWNRVLDPWLQSVRFSQVLFGFPLYRPCRSVGLGKSHLKMITCWLKKRKVLRLNA